MSPKADPEKCKYCGTKGHGRNPNFDLKKSSCPAFNNKCRQCKRKGHFQDFCNRLKDNNVTKDNTVEGKTVQVTKVGMPWGEKMLAKGDDIEDIFEPNGKTAKYD